MADKTKNDSVLLEDNIKALDEVITELESGKLSLEQSFDKYKEGMDLLVKCNNSIDKVEKELVVLESEGI